MWKRTFVRATLIAAVLLAPSQVAARTPTRAYPIFVGKYGIERGVLQHWVHIMRGLGGTRRDGVRFVVEYRRARREALRLGLKITRDDRRRAYRKEVRSYGKHQLRQELRESGQSWADVRVRIYYLYYSDRVRDRWLAGVPAPEREQTLQDYGVRFRQRWRARTHCAPAFYVSSVCR
jgi:hypothetical protein